MKKLLIALGSILVIALSYTAQGASNAAFPKGWETWPVAKSGVIPSNKSAIPANVPAIVQDTIKTYNWVQDGKGSAYNVRINPAQKLANSSGKGYGDGATAVLELTDIKVLLVTEHLLGEPQYGVYSYDGKDLSGIHPSLNPRTCTTCHTGYEDACRHGICSMK